MRWLPLVLALPAAAAGYYAALHLRVRHDRQATPGLVRPLAVERLLRSLEAAPAPGQQPVLTPEERAHPWAQAAFLDGRASDDALRAFADKNPGSAPGAFALLRWTRRAAKPSERMTRRAAFRSQYPGSWILAAWEAEGRR